MSNQFKCLEIGGGYAPHHPDYEQLDISGDKVQYKWHAGKAQWPVPESYFDIIYASHVLEHNYEDEAIIFIQQAYRALKPNGKFQIAMPDFEKICLKYLEVKDMNWQFGKAFGHNGDSILQQLYGSAPLDKERLVHHVLFDKKLITEALLAAGFKDIKTYDVNPYYLNLDFIKLFGERVYHIRKQSEMYVECIK